jgi:quinol-cytochrome oxidoreductase complex cytochrome b subunit
VKSQATANHFMLLEKQGSPEDTEENTNDEAKNNRINFAKWWQ